jgi:hypothetical protein
MIKVLMKNLKKTKKMMMMTMKMMKKKGNQKQEKHSIHKGKNSFLDWGNLKVKILFKNLQTKSL